MLSQDAHVTLLQVHGETSAAAVPRDFDILEIPVEGVAAYWLAIKKLVGSKRNFKLLQDEASYTVEPFIKHLLETICLNGEQLRPLTAAKRDVLLAELKRKLDLMRIALLDMSSADNPAKTLVRMTAQFAASPIDEEKAFNLAQELLVFAAKPEEKARFFNVDHKMRNEQLIVALLFYVLWSRREGKIGCRTFGEFVDSKFFADGLALVIDGFDSPFVRQRLGEHQDAILAETRLKMDMSIELAAAIHSRLQYEQVFQVAKAFMV